MLFIEVIFRNLAGRKVHAALTVVTLSVAVATTILLFGAAWGFANASTASFQSRGVDIVVVRAGVVERMNSSLRSSQSAVIRSVPGVLDVDGTLMESVSLGKEGMIAIPLLGHDPAGFSLNNLEISSGRKLTADDRSAVLLGAGLAQSLKKSPGDSIEIEGAEFRVLGIFVSDNPVEANVIVALLKDVQKLMDRPEQVSQFEVRIDSEKVNDNSLAPLCRAIESLRENGDRSLGLQAMPVRQFVSSNTRSKLATAMAWGTTLITVLLSSLGVLNTMLVSVLERTREIGVLRAIGWSQSRVLSMILGESMVLGCMAIVIGSAGSVGIAILLAQLPAIAELMGPVSMSALLFGGVPAFVATILGSLYPAWRAATIPATEALRYE